MLLEALHHQTANMWLKRKIYLDLFSVVTYRKNQEYPFTTQNQRQENKKVKARVKINTSRW